MGRTVLHGRACGSNSGCSLADSGLGSTPGAPQAAPVAAAAARAWPASQQERAEGRGRSAPSPFTAPEIQTRPGGGSQSLSPAAPWSRPLGDYRGWAGVAGALCPRQALPPSQKASLPFHGEGQRPGLPACAPQSQLKRRGRARALGRQPPLWAKLGWKHSDRPRLSAPCPRPGE